MATSTERSNFILTAFSTKADGYSVRLGSRRLVFTQLPTPVLRSRDVLPTIRDGLIIDPGGKAGETIGVEVMVRLFQGLTEVHIDPHRIILNPPLVPRANLTSVHSLDEFDNPVQIRVVGAQAPEAALVEALLDSIASVPNAAEWRP